MNVATVNEIKALIRALAIMGQADQALDHHQEVSAPQEKDVYGNLGSHAVTRGVGTVLHRHKKIAERAGVLAGKKRRKRKKEKRNDRS